MPLSGLDFAPCRFSTSALPLQDRLPAWREFARGLVSVDIQGAANDPPFECHATLRALPGLGVGWWAGSASHIARTPEIVAQGGDTFGVVINEAGSMTALQRGREVQIAAGEAALMLHSQPAALAQSRGRGICLVLPRASLAMLAPRLEDAALHPVPCTDGALRLLKSYLKALASGGVIQEGSLRSLAATYVQDLVALIVGASRDGAVVAEERGAAAARLAAIKADIVERIGREELTLDGLAARHGVTPRSIQRLFEREGSTFAAFRLEQQLALARRMLGDRRYADWTIAAVALAAGFGDLSYFHRAFRRRFGATPSDLRAASDP